MKQNPLIILQKEFEQLLVKYHSTMIQHQTKKALEEHRRNNKLESKEK